MNDLISVVTPVYGSPESLPELAKRIQTVFRGMGQRYELIMVDDRCPKGSWDVLTALAETDPVIVAVRLSRNFGQHAAIYAGLAQSIGDWVVVMDCDLQDRPEEIPALLAGAEGQGADMVLASRTARKDNRYRRAISWAFYRCLSYLTGVTHTEKVANFGVYSRKVIDALLSWDERLVYFPAAARWVGFKAVLVNVAHDKRHSGTSSYSYRTLLRLAASIIVSFSEKPLQIIALSGLMISFFAFIFGITLALMALLGFSTVPGWASVFVSIWLLSGLLLFTNGFMGLYIGQTMREAKGRPNYIVDVIVSKAR